MRQIFDAIVIGSGSIGAAIAFSLTHAGVRHIALLDKGPLASGMTRRSAGLVHPFHLHPAVAHLSRATYLLFRQWNDRIPGPSPLVETGAVALGTGAQAVESSGECRELGSGAQDAKSYSFFSPSIPDATYCPSAGYVDATQVAQLLARRAQAQGAQVLTGTMVKRVLAQGKRVEGVETTVGTLHSTTVIAAAGVWSSQLLKPLGVSLGVKGTRGIIAFIDRPQSIPSALPLVLYPAKNFFLRPHSFGLACLGMDDSLGRPAAIETFDELITPAEKATLLRVSSELVPTTGDSVFKRAHPILSVSTDKGAPIVGRFPTLEGLYVAAGFGSNAPAVALAVGDAIADLIVSNNARIDISTLAPSA